MTRAAADRALRGLMASTLIGVVLIVVVAVVVSEHRGLLLAIGGIYLLASVGAYIGLRRSLDRALAAQERELQERGEGL
jgi:uncharacterized membrane protein